ncbi:MAG: hypothetical protein GXO19_06305 [Epsilonproteobacteria bacterium]|nr:hypothetical protein [Campylobacterota bacterium]NPA57328.1 hypothetical protein [Campylobacterota bacterium]
MRLHLFYLFLILFILGWLILFKPYELISLRENIPTLRFQNFTFKELETNGTTLMLDGKYGAYQHRRVYIVAPKIYLVGKSERLRADKGIYRSRIVKLKGSVAYRSPTYRFYTDRANYVVDKEIIYTPTHFWFESPELNVSGSKLFYLRRSGKIVGYDINAKALIR